MGTLTALNIRRNTFEINTAEHGPLAGRFAPRLFGGDYPQMGRRYEVTLKEDVTISASGAERVERLLLGIRLLDA